MWPLSWVKTRNSDSAAASTSTEFVTSPSSRVFYRIRVTASMVLVHCTL
jgi:hypothetical protein